MNKTTLALFTLISFFAISSFAQRSGGASKEVTITGKVMDKDTNTPLEYATIAFTNSTTKEIVTGGITDPKGNFSIPVAAGTYDVSIEFIGFETITIPNKQLRTNENLGTFSLGIDAETLDQVEIIAERTTVEIKLDKKIYNVGKDLTVRGGTVSDVLDNVPSVSVDVEGNVALRGNDDVRILINGKPSGLVGLNSTDALRQLPAESIERVEVITSPSARYDAEGSAGILNIILRRSKLQGLNGAITLNGGYPFQAGAAGNINYRTGDFNFFTNAGYNIRKIPGNSFSETEFFNGDEPSSFLREDREFDRDRRGGNTNFGVEWYVNETSSLTGSFVYRDSDNESNTVNIVDELDASGSIIDRNIRRDPELEDDKTVQYALNYDKQFNGNSQHRFTFDFQYESSEESEASLISQNGIDVENVLTDELQDRILLQTDFVKPIGETGQFELGYRGEFFDLSTDFLVEFSDENGDFSVNTDLTNTLNFDQKVNAFYTQYGDKVKNKFSYLLGLRFEETRITIEQLTSNDFNKKTFAQLFPTVNLGYEISEDENITLGYNRRIRRPRSRFLNPFPSRSSATNLFQGNPDLNPSTSDQFDLGYLKRMGKLTLNGSVYFQRQNDAFNFVSLATDNFFIFETNQLVNINDADFEQLNQQFDLVPVIRRTPINLATNDRYGGEITVTYRPNRKWFINGNVNVFQSITRGDFEGQNFDAENLSWFIRLNNKYTLPGEIDWQTRLFYRGPSETAQSRNKGIFSLNLAFSKDIFNEKGSIAFNVSDVLNSRKRMSEAFTPTFEGESEFQWRVRTFNLSFTYRFNQKKSRQRNSYGGGDDGDFEG